MLASVGQDLRYALRQLRKAPGFVLTVVGTLALGIGSSAAIFCLMDALWLHPMHVPQSGSLVRIFSTTPQTQEDAFSYFEYQTLQQRVTALKGLAAVGARGSLMPRPDGTSQMVLTNVVSTNFFDVLGVKAHLGRFFTAQDAARLRVHPGVVVGFRFWQRNFGGDPGIVGRQIFLRHGKDQIVPVDVWGVLPADFRDLDSESDRDLWMPAETWVGLTGPSELAARKFRWFNLVGRLAPGSTVSDANRQVSTVASALQQADHANNHDRGARAIGDLRYRLSLAGASGIVLFAIVGGVVLLCTVNVAHLLLARGLQRSPEVALRISLGATRVAVARQLLVENLLLCVLGFVSGLGLAAGIAAALPSLLVAEPEMLFATGDARHFFIDWRVFAFASILALLTMMLLALVPLAQVLRPQLVPALRATGAGRTTGRTSALRRAAVWLQIGISFALLVSTGALVRSFLNARTRPIGITRSQVLVAFTQDPDDTMRKALLDRLGVIPGVRQVAYAIRSPLMPSEGGIAVDALLPSHPELRDPVSIKFNAVSPNYLSVTGTRVVRGRGFTAPDDADGPMAILVNQTMAQKYWTGQNPIGQTVKLANGRVEAHVVGVTENAPIVQLGEMPEPYLYIPFHQYQQRLSDMGEITFLLATDQNAMSLAQDTRQTLIHVHPLLDPMLLTSLPELLRYSAGRYQLMAELVTTLGIIGLALTVVGLYGFLAFRVAQRRREIGIRMALGASRVATTRLVVRDALSLAAAGMLIGTVLAIAATRLEASALYGVRPFDLVSLAGALLVLALSLTAAAWLPARRAAAVDPMAALRNE